MNNFTFLAHTFTKIFLETGKLFESKPLNPDVHIFFSLAILLEPYRGKDIDFYYLWSMTKDSLYGLKPDGICDLLCNAVSLAMIPIFEIDTKVPDVDITNAIAIKLPEIHQAIEEFLSQPKGGIQEKIRAQAFFRSEYLANALVFLRSQGIDDTEIQDILSVTDSLKNTKSSNSFDSGCLVDLCIFIIPVAIIILMAIF